jgi:SAM-dependent methyltransferase
MMGSLDQREPAGTPWDALSDYFDTSKDDAAIPAGAADNILIAWPVILDFLASVASELRSVRALDLGCGAGGFAHRLRQLGAEVTGLDPSPAMIAKARAAYGEAVDWRVGDASLLRTLPPFGVITSIMAIQFVADLDSLFADLAAALEPNGVLAIAVHNPAYFQGDTLRFSNGVAVPIFIRTAADYHAVARANGFEPRLEAYPPFTADFLARYPEHAGGDAPEYLILGYRRGG